MKNILLLIPIFILAIGSCSNNNSSQQPEKISDEKGTIIINGANVLYPIMLKWKQEFQKKYPKVTIEIMSTSSDNAIKKVSSGIVNLAMSSRPLGEKEIQEGMYQVAVAKDVVLPVINFDNPIIQKIVTKGINAGMLSDIFSGKIKTWGELFNTDSKDPIEVYALADTTGTTQIWRNLTKLGNKQIKATIMYNSKAIVNTIVTKPNSIGYCSSSNIYDPVSNIRRKNIYVVPVDFNINGQTDDNEQVYDTYDQLKRAVTEGKYPYPPARDIFLVFKKDRFTKADYLFINWILGIGQNFIPSMGLINIDRKMSEKSIQDLSLLKHE